MPGEITCTVTGMDAFQQMVFGLVPQIRSETGAELRREMVGVMEISRELCPVESGKLAASGRIDGPTLEGEVGYCYLSYGGENEVPYALIQHERLDFRHAAGKQAKFLERPILEWTDDGPERLMRRVAGRLLRRSLR